MSITKESILQKVSSYDILNRYLQPYHNKGPRLTQGTNIQNPLIPEKQKTPSFNIYCDIQGGNQWKFNDFATGDHGSCMDLVMQLFFLDFPGALQRINEDFNLGLSSKSAEKKDSKSQNNVASKEKPFTVNTRPFSKDELAFWNNYGITEATLKLFNVVSVSGYSSINKEGKPFSYKCQETEMVFAYQHDTWCKIYKPADSKYKFSYLGKKPDEYVYGYEQLPPDGKLVFLAAGEKDVICLTAHGFHAVTLNSETAGLKKSLITELKQRFQNFIILYDNDTTGLSRSVKLSQEHGLKCLLLPAMEGGKDISDFFRLQNPVEDFVKLIDHVMAEAEQAPALPPQFISALQILKLEATKMPCLWDPFFPYGNLGAVTGSSDSGKSAIARQIAINIIACKSTFLGFDLKPRTGNVYYVSSEDGIEATSILLKMQLKGLTIPDEKFNNLHFLFECEDLIQKLDDALIKRPADMVILDTFGDLFTGREMNASAQIRFFLSEYAILAKKHNCFFLFIHHVGKRTESLEPSKHNAIGSQSFEAKMRIVMELRSDENDMKHLSIVKGNYLSREEKKKSYILNFDEATLSFSNTDQRRNFSDLGESSNGKKKYTVDWISLFGTDTVLKLKEIKSRLKDALGMPDGTAYTYATENLISCLPFGHYCLPESSASTKSNENPFPQTYLLD